MCVFSLLNICISMEWNQKLDGILLLDRNIKP